MKLPPGWNDWAGAAGGTQGMLGGLIARPRRRCWAAQVNLKSRLVEPIPTARSVLLELRLAVWPVPMPWGSVLLETQVVLYPLRA